MIDELEKNIDSEIGMLREIVNYLNQEEAAPADKKLIDESIASLVQSIKLVNNSIPRILENISAAKRLPALEKPTELEKISFNAGNVTRTVIVNKEDRQKFLKEAGISEKMINRVKKGEEAGEESYEEFKATRGYLKYSNKYFLNTAQNWTKKGNFAPLAVELKKSNLDVLFDSYVAMIFFTTTLALIVSAAATIFLTFFNFNLSWPILSLYQGNYLLRLLTLIWIPLVIPIAVFAALYYYPSTEKKSIAGKIDQELPFAVIYMSAISGAGIEPTEIFKIIGLSKEYPYLRREIRKVINQINIYGYDLVTSLNNVAKTTPSTKLAEVFSGIGTTINSGGSLSEFFEKRAETLLLGYRLERENYTKLAETFMDIYISVVIATPMILMLILIVLSVAAPDLGLSPTILTTIIVSAVAVVNIFFLIFLQIKQPSY